MAPKSEFTEKLPNPFSIRLSDAAAKGLDRLRKQSGLSDGDMVEWLLRETSPIKAIKRNRPGNLTERVSFRLSERGDELLRGIMAASRASGGDIIEAYVNRAISTGR
mgnify:CR=1 FL=1|tara:strand:+ start:77 stop:397 length:321 start_codon:yes stop_codon:yes gene_type:complete